MICRAVWPFTTLKSSKKLNLFKNLRWLVGIFGGPGIPADLSSLACRGAPRVPGQVSPDALDTRLDRFVGLKALPAEKVADTDLKRRFVQGATAISALHHPNVIRVCHARRSEGTDSNAREHYAFEAAAQPVDDQEPSLSELSWNRPHV